MDEQVEVEIRLPEGRDDLYPKVKEAIEANGTFVGDNREIIPILIPIIGGLLTAAGAAKILNDIFVMTDCSILVDMTGAKPVFDSNCEKYGTGKYILVTERDGKIEFDAREMSSIKLEDLLKLGMAGGDEEEEEKEDPPADG